MEKNSKRRNRNFYRNSIIKMAKACPLATMLVASTVLLSCAGFVVCLKDGEIPKSTIERPMFAFALANDTYSLKNAADEEYFGEEYYDEEYLDEEYFDEKYYNQDGEPDEDMSQVAEGTSAPSETPAQVAEGTSAPSETPAQVAEGTSAPSETPAQVAEGTSAPSETPAHAAEGTSAQSETPAQVAEGTSAPSETPAQVAVETSAQSETPAQVAEGTSAPGETSAQAAEGNNTPSETPAQVTEGNNTPSDKPAQTTEETTHVENIYKKVDKKYFDDALFIGDSRVEGLKLYSGLDNATFYCKEGISLTKILKEKIVKMKIDGKKKDVTISKALKEKKFGKIYLMIGINEISYRETKDFKARYKDVVDEIKELQPEAKIIILGMMKVTEEYAKEHPSFSNKNIETKNKAIASLADNVNIFYLDFNPDICDSEGNVKKKYTWDGVHLKAEYYSIWVDFMKKHGI